MSAWSTQHIGPEEVEAIGEAMGHPVRFRIATALEEQAGLSAGEVADRIGEPARKVRYQLQLLREAGLVQISERRERRGAIEHRYAMSQRLYLADEEYDALPARARGRVGLEVFRLIAADVIAASSRGLLGTRRGHSEIRFIGDVDLAGWEQLARLHWGCLRETEGIFEAAHKRTRKPREAVFPVTLALLLLERPDPPGPPAGQGPAPEFALVEALAAARGGSELIRLAFLIGDEPGLTVREMAQRTEDSQRRIRYRLDLLRDARLVVVSGGQQRGGAVEHRYSMVRRVVLGDADIGLVDASQRVRLALEVFRNIASDVAAASRERSFGVRPGHAQIRYIGEVDEQGWMALSAMGDRFLATVEDILDRCEARLSQPGSEGIGIMTALLLLERPQPSSS